MILAHKIRLDPNFKQAAYFSRAAGTSRLVWNWALAEWKRQYAEGGKPTAFSLKKQFNAIKYELFPWMSGVHRDAHAAPFTNLQNAFSRFFNKKSKHPAFKSRGRSKDAFAVANDRVRVDGMRVKLPVIGWIRMREELRFSGRVLSISISRTANNWYIAFQVDVGEINRQRTSNGIVGVDLGVKALAVTSSGRVFESPKPLARFLAKLARLQRWLARKTKQSKRRQVLKLKIARLYAKIRNIRQDSLHKVTTELCRENQAVVVEDLCVKGMLRNRKLSRAISDLGFGEFRRQLAYKSAVYGSKLVVVNRWYPSSKTCSNCQSVKEVLLLSDRIFKCDCCGMEIDRDLNAARNLHTVGLTEIYARGPEGSGSDQKPERNHAGMKRELKREQTHVCSQIREQQS